MSTEVVDDLFPEDEENVAPEKIEPGVASASRTPELEVKQDSPVKDEVGDEDGDMGDLFGDEEEPAPPNPRADSPSTPRSPSRTPSQTPNPLEYPEQDPLDPEVELTYVTLTLPTWPHMQPSDGKVWGLKLPSYVNIEGRPFDPDYYRATQVDEEEEEKGSREKELIKARTKMIGVRNTIRWRWRSEGDEQVRQTNSRILRWSDGSMSLQTGSDFFDLAPSHGASLTPHKTPLPPSQPQAQSQTQTQTQSPNPAQSLPDLKPPVPTSSSSTSTYIYSSFLTQRILHSESPLTGTLTLIPTSMSSKTHLELAAHVGSSHVRHSRMKVLGDNEEETKVLLRKAAGFDGIVLDRPVKNGGRKGGGGGGGGAKGKGGGKKRWSSDEEEEYGGGGGGGGKRSGRGTGGVVGGMGGRWQVERDEEDDDGFIVDDSDDEGVRSSGGSDFGGKGKGKKKGNLDGAGGKRKSRRNKGDDDEEEELDEMEVAERRIEAREREKKRAKKEREKAVGAGKEKGKKDGKKSRDYGDSEDDEEEEGQGEVAGEEEDMEMDVESEDD